MEVVVIRKQYRHPTRSLLWGAYVVAVDDLGTWLFTPSGTVWRGEQAGAELNRSPSTKHVLHLSPHGDWWFARWDDAGVTYVDLARPTVVSGDEWRYDDLYLDLYREGDGPFEVHDEDELAEAIALGHVDDDEVRQVEATRTRLLSAVAASTPPFDDGQWDRLRRASALDLAPLCDLPPVLLDDVERTD